MTVENQFIEDQLLLITKKTFEVFLTTDYPGDCLALYLFYYYTAKWQGTDTIKATTGYAAKGLKWTEDKVRRAKKILVEDLRIIQDIQRKDRTTGLTIGWYLKIRYFFDIQAGDYPEGGLFQRVEKSDTNAFEYININASKNILNKNAGVLSLTSGKEEKKIDQKFVDFALALKAHIKANNPEAKDPTEANIMEWANEARLMVERDGRDLVKMRVVLDWSQKSDFWRSNILSVGKFRKQYDKLTLQMKPTGKSSSLIQRERGLHYEVKKKPIGQ